MPLNKESLHLLAAPFLTAAFANTMFDFIWSILTILSTYDPNTLFLFFFFHSSHNLKLKNKGKKRQSPSSHSPNSPTDYFYLSETLSFLLSLDNKLSHLSPYSSLISFHGSRHTISCSPALFADGRDERDGAGWLLGYWALSTNGRPWQGRFHAPPPRRQPSEQHSHLSTLFLFPPFSLFLISFCLKRSYSQRSDLLLEDLLLWLLESILEKVY